MDLSKLSLGDMIVAASGFLLLLFAFFPWFGVDEIDGGPNGFDFFLFGTIPVLLGLLMVAVVAVRAFSPQTKLPDLPVGWGQALFGAGVLAAALVVLKLLIGDEILGFDLDRKFGIFLAALAALGLAAGGFIKSQEEKSGPSAAGGERRSPF